MILRCFTWLINTLCVHRKSTRQLLRPRVPAPAIPANSATPMEQTAPGAGHGFKTSVCLPKNAVQHSHKVPKLEFDSGGFS